jgi:hypothetical protein
MKQKADLGCDEMRKVRNLIFGYDLPVQISYHHFAVQAA